MTFGPDPTDADEIGHVPSSLDPAIPRHPSEFACIDLVNSAFTNHVGRGPAIDRLPLEAWQAWFLERYKLTPERPEQAPVDELIALRGQLRILLERWAETGSVSKPDIQRLDAWVSGPTLRQRVSADGRRPQLTLEPSHRDWSWAIAAIAASAVELIRLDAPARLKVCANPNCSFMFYDHSLNRSRRFCSTSPCASIVRVRRFREARNRPSEPGQSES